MGIPGRINRIYHNIWDPVLAIISISCTMCVVKKPDDPLNTDEGQDLIMELNKSQKTSWMPMIIVAAATFVSALDATFMNVSMSQVVADLNTDVATIQKMVTFYTLITASLLLVSAKLQDIAGKRKVFLLGMMVYAVGDLTAAVSPNATVLFIGWSVLEGIGSALMSPAMISIVTETYSGTQRTRALAIVSTIAGVAVAVGPLFGGVVTTMLSWRYGFYFELIIIAFVLAFSRKITDFPGTAGLKDLDITGCVLSVAGLLLFMLGVLQLSDKNTLLCVVLLAAGIAFLLAFGIFELRRSKKGRMALFDVRLLKDRNLRNGTLVRLTTALIMGGVMFTSSVFLLSVLKLTAFETGLTLVPMTVGMMAASIVAPKLAVKIGHRYSMIPGFAIGIAGCLMLRNRFTPDITLTSLLPGMFVLGFGLGLPMSLSIDAPLLTIPRQAQNSCSGLVSTGQSLGLSMGTSIIGTVMTLGAVGGLRQAINTYTPLELSEEAFRANAEMYMQKMGHVDPLSLTVRDQAAYQKIINTVCQDAMGVVMMVILGLMAAGAVLAFTLKPKQAKTEPAPKN